MQRVLARWIILGFAFPGEEEPHYHLQNTFSNWSEQSACDQRSNLGRPLFLVIIFSLSPPLFKTQEGVVVGFQKFAWAPD